MMSQNHAANLKGKLRHRNKLLSTLYALDVFLEWTEEREICSYPQGPFHLLYELVKCWLVSTVQKLFLKKRIY